MTERRSGRVLGELRDHLAALRSKAAVTQEAILTAPPEKVEMLATELVATDLAVEVLEARVDAAEQVEQVEHSDEEKTAALARFAELKKQSRRLAEQNVKVLDHLLKIGQEAAAVFYEERALRRKFGELGLSDPIAISLPLGAASAVPFTDPRAAHLLDRWLKRYDRYIGATGERPL